MEYLDVVDEKDQPLGFTKPKKWVHRDGDWHRTTHIYVVNSRREVLCNLRHADKDLFPSVWDLSFGGHVSAGENYAQGAQRELEEELGVPVLPHEMHYLFSLTVDGYEANKKIHDREHTAVYLWRTDSPVEAFPFQKEEIEAIRFFPSSELKQNLQAEKPELPLLPLPRMFLYALTQIDRFLDRLPLETVVPVFNWEESDSPS